MADKFLFTNFAISTLTSSLSSVETFLRLNTDDVARFPSLLPGTKFPLILADDDNHVEIVYVTQLLGSGVATVERGMEGTQAQSWLAGTLLRHAFTAATIMGGAFPPRGIYNPATLYTQGDLVTHNGLSFVATTTSLGEEPYSGSALWQVLYEPPGAASSAMNYQGLWNDDTTYSPGMVARWNGRIWRSKANNTGSEPSVSNADWEPLALWAGSVHFEPSLVFSGVNNYTVSITTALAPTQLYDGLTVRGRFSSTNSGNVTLQINSLAAVPGRPSSGTDFLANSIVVGEMYEFTYAAATSEFIALSSPGIGATIAQLQGLVATAAGGSVPIGTILDFAGGSAPSGWLLCNGNQVSKTAYATLYALVGTTFGAETSTTFALPDCRGRARFGVDAGAGRLGLAALGATGGEESHILTTAELPSHTHGVNDPGHAHTINDPGHAHGYTPPAITSGYAAGVANAAVLGAPTNTSSASTGVTIASGTTGLTVQSAGSGTAHNNVPPAIVVNAIIRAL